MSHVSGRKIFDFVILKEGVAGTSPAKPYILMALTIELYSVVFMDCIFGVKKT